MSGGEDACWPFMGGRDTNKNGEYGHLQCLGRQWKAHRLAYTLTYGPIPRGLWVLHKCDYPPCCNPRHLFLGTLADTVADRDAKQRRPPGCHVPYAHRPRGTGHGRAKLTEADVRAILASDEVQQVLADRYGVAQTVISKIKRREIWRHVELRNG
jgi:hypothetical protein